MRDPGAALRTWSPGYIGAVDAWWGALLPRVRPLLLSHGGPVAMVQVAARRRALAPPLTLYKTARKGCAGRAAAGRAGGGLSGGRAGFQVENEFGSFGNVAESPADRKSAPAPPALRLRRGAGAPARRGGGGGGQHATV